jgi:hypothetical protein
MDTGYCIIRIGVLSRAARMLVASTLSRNELYPKTCSNSLSGAVKGFAVWLFDVVRFTTPIIPNTGETVCQTKLCQGHMIRETSRAACSEWTRNMRLPSPL